MIVLVNYATTFEVLMEFGNCKFISVCVLSLQNFMSNDNVLILISIGHFWNCVMHSLRNYSAQS